MKDSRAAVADELRMRMRPPIHYSGKNGHVLDAAYSFGNWILLAGTEVV
jgi:hypothetical protein